MELKSFMFYKEKVNKYIYLFFIFIIIVFSQCSTANNNDTSIKDKNNIQDIDTNLTSDELKGVIDFAPDFETHQLLLTNTEKVKDIVNIYYEIISILYLETVDYVKLKTLYQNSAISNKVVELDTIYKHSYHLKILNYFGLGENGLKNINIKIETLLIRILKDAMFLEISQAIDDKNFENKTTKGSPNHWDKAYEYYKALIPTVEKAYNYWSEDDIKIENFEKHFLNGANYVYDKNEKAKQLLYIESERIEKKVIKALFLNMIRNITFIEEEKAKTDINYDKVLKNVIYAKGYFKSLSDTLKDDNDIKQFVVREISKTFTMKKDTVVIKTILHLFYNQSYNLLINIGNEFHKLSHNELVNTTWNAYFYYTIFNFDYERRLGKDTALRLDKLWATLIKSIQEKKYDDSIILTNEITEYLLKYKKNIEKLIDK